jgi:hypothetical protein
MSGTACAAADADGSSVEDCADGVVDDEDGVRVEVGVGVRVAVGVAVTVAVAVVRSETGRAWCPFG